jgi:serine/threonine protein kinase
MASPRAHSDDLRRKYILQARIGRGGFGEVYKARRIGREGFMVDVALKVVYRESRGACQPVERLRDEARVLGMLNHPNIVRVNDLVRVMGAWCIEMELVEGVPLSEFVDPRRRMPVGCVLELIWRVSDALAAAYSAPGPNGAPLYVLHRDIKPSNLLLTAHGLVKIVDFGISEALFDSREAHTSGGVLGTKDYMSRERLQGLSVPQSDVYALGVTAIELLSGRSFGGEPHEKLRAADRFERARAHFLDVPGEVEELLVQMIAPNHERRPVFDDLTERARRLQARAPTVNLAVWGGTLVPGMLAERERRPMLGESLSGKIVFEESATQPPLSAPQTAETPAQTTADDLLVSAARSTSGRVVAFVSRSTPQLLVAATGFGLWPKALVAGVLGLGLGGVITADVLESAPQADPVAVSAVAPASRPAAAASGEAQEEPLVEEPAPVEDEVQAEATTPTLAAPTRAPRPVSSSPSRAAEPPARRVTLRVQGDVVSVQMQTAEGVTPLPPSLPPGRHRLVIQLPHQTEPVIQTINVPEAETVTLVCSAHLARCRVE